MKKSEQDQFEVLRKINKKSDITQRELSSTLGLSLGKINYCLNSLKEKGFIKIKNFTKSKNKLKYMYVLTPQGISEKTKITINFMKQKMSEYDELKLELLNIKAKSKK